MRNVIAATFVSVLLTVGTVWAQPGGATSVSAGPFSGSPLRMAESTRAAFTAAWGEPASGVVQTVPEHQLVDALWSAAPSWGIVPFEKLEVGLPLRFRPLLVNEQTSVGFGPS